ncbi:MAG: DUF3810 domain-containing protein [Flavisolibacter sp.]
MFKSLLRDKILLTLVVLALAIKGFSLQESWVENYYTYGFYPIFSGLLRGLFGWIPFSIGDVTYLAAFIFLVLKSWKLIRLLAKRQVKEYLSWILFRKYLRLVLWIYIVFNVFWGLNYNREGIAQQLGLEVKTYNATDLYELTAALQQQLNHYAELVDTVGRARLNDNRVLFEEGLSAYDKLGAGFPFLRYHTESIKPSLYSHIGQLFGFTGYYNPFSGEAQIKTTVPVFIKPFVLCHEMGHQLGYAKENEANMVGFLSGRVSDDLEFRYAAYYDAYTYAMGELRRYDTTGFKVLRKTVHPQFKRDYRTYLEYIYNSRNVVEPLMSNFYESYLKMNNQPKGKATYNEVVAWLVAYMKKFGKEAI